MSMICNFYESSLPTADIHPLVTLIGKANLVSWHSCSTYGQPNEFNIMSCVSSHVMTVGMSGAHTGVEAEKAKDLGKC